MCGVTRELCLRHRLLERLILKLHALVSLWKVSSKACVFSWNNLNLLKINLG